MAPRTGTDTVRRTLRMAARFKSALDHGDEITRVTLQEEFDLSQSTVKRFIRLYRDELDNDFIWDAYGKTYTRNRIGDNK